MANWWLKPPPPLGFHWPWQIVIIWVGMVRRKISTCLSRLNKKPMNWVQFMLGVCHRYGYGTARDDIKAREWYAKSSAQKNSLALELLGWLLSKQNQSGRIVWKKCPVGIRWCNVPSWYMLHTWKRSHHRCNPITRVVGESSCTRLYATNRCYELICFFPQKDSNHGLFYVLVAYDWLFNGPTLVSRDILDPVVRAVEKECTRLFTTAVSWHMMSVWCVCAAVCGVCVCVQLLCSCSYVMSQHK